MYKAYLGIDSGLTGAIASITNGGEPIMMDDLPVTAFGKIKWIDGLALLEQIRRARGGFAQHECMVTIEMTHAMPKNGCIAAHSQGKTLGSILATVQIAGLPFTLVSPASWKAAMKITSKGMSDGARKELARARAQMVMPGFADQLARKKDHNRAESALLAYWGLMNGIGKEAA